MSAAKRQSADRGKESRGAIRWRNAAGPQERQCAAEGPGPRRVASRMRWRCVDRQRLLPGRRRKHQADRRTTTPSDAPKGPNAAAAPRGRSSRGAKGAGGGEAVNRRGSGQSARRAGLGPSSAGHGAELTRGASGSATGKSCRGAPVRCLYQAQEISFVSVCDVRSRLAFQFIRLQRSSRMLRYISFTCRLLKRRTSSEQHMAIRLPAAWLRRCMIAHIIKGATQHPIASSSCDRTNKFSFKFSARKRSSHIHPAAFQRPSLIEKQL